MFKEIKMPENFLNVIFTFGNYNTKIYKIIFYIVKGYINMVIKMENIITNTKFRIMILL